MRVQRPIGFRPKNNLRRKGCGILSKITLLWRDVNNTTKNIRHYLCLIKTIVLSKRIIRKMLKRCRQLMYKIHKTMRIVHIYHQHLMEHHRLEMISFTDDVNTFSIYIELLCNEKGKCD